MIAIIIFLIGHFAIELFTGLSPVIIADFIISSACLVFCFFIDIAAPIVASLDKEAFEKGFGEKYDEKYDEKTQKKAKKGCTFGNNLCNTNTWKHLAFNLVIK